MNSKNITCEDTSKNLSQKNLNQKNLNQKINNLNQKINNLDDQNNLFVKNNKCIPFEYLEEFEYEFDDFRDRPSFYAS